MACIVALVALACGGPDDDSTDDTNNAQCTEDADCPGEDSDCVDGACESTDDNQNDAQCPEAADCAERECGEDPVCGTSCGTCEEGTCSEDRQCEADECQPACADIECGGDDGCGGDCGACGDGEVCEENQCVDESCQQTLDASLSTTTLAGDCTYRIDDRLTIEENATVTVEAGARLEVTGLHSIVIDGILDLRGDADNPVVLSTDRSPPSAGDWGNLYVGDDASLRARHAEIEYFSGLRSWRGDLDFQHTTVRHARPTNHLGEGVDDVRGAIDLGQSSTAILEYLHVEDVSGTSPIGVVGFDISSMTVEDSTFTAIDGAGVSVSGFGPSDSAGISVAHSHFENTGTAVVIYDVGSSSVTKNQIEANSTGIYVSAIGTTDNPEYTVTQNNLVDNTNWALEAEEWAEVIATDNYWGDGVDPADVVTSDGLGSVDTSNPQDTPIEDAGPR